MAIFLCLKLAKILDTVPLREVRDKSVRLLVVFFSFVNQEDGTTHTTTNHQHSLSPFSPTWKGTTDTVLASHSTRNVHRPSPSPKQ